MQFQYRLEGIFHIVLRGQCYLRVGDLEEFILLQEGDAVAFPTGGVHWISNAHDSQNLHSGDVLSVTGDEELFLIKSGDVRAYPSDTYSPETPIEITGSSSDNSLSALAGTTLFSAILSYDANLKHPFLKSLPCFVRGGARTNGERNTLQILASLLAEESTTSHPGKRLMVDNLSEVLFIQILRSYMSGTKHPSGYMTALADQKIGQALNLIHTESEHKWTVDSLSRAVAMSGTTFTKKFGELVGITPKAYLINTRLLKARAKLQSTNESILSIARSAGYTSEAAFSKAFKKHFNTPPGELRKRHRRDRFTL